MYFENSLYRIDTVTEGYMGRAGFIHCLVICLLLFFVQGCGNNKGDAFDFNTVTATVSADPAKNPLLADLAKWTGDSCASASEKTIRNDVINFTVATTSEGSTGTPSPLMLNKATITLKPADTSTPPLPVAYSPIYQNLKGTMITAGVSTAVPIEVVTHSLKEYFNPTLVCSGNSAIYSYNATITFDAVEVNTGKSGQVSAGMTVRFADFADN